MENERKQVIIIRRDLKMRRGKEISQGCHASLGAILRDGKLKTDKDTKIWLEGRFTKICVRVESEEELLEIYNQARNAKLNCSLITDAGLTEFNGVPTLTAVAVGPGKPEIVDKITGHLQLL